MLEACPEVHDLKLAARFTTRTPANWKNIVDNYLECYHCRPAHQVSPTPYRLIVTGTPCTVTGHCNTVSPNRPNSRLNLKRLRMRHSTVSGCGRARC
ncbi:SRPBCC family protein [Shigella flexneri]